MRQSQRRRVRPCGINFYAVHHMCEGNSSSFFLRSVHLTRILQVLLLIGPGKGWTSPYIKIVKTLKLNAATEFGAKLQNTPQLWSASLTCVGRLWRSRPNTIDAILIQWHVNELRGILKLLRVWIVRNAILEPSLCFCLNQVGKFSWIVQSNMNALLHGN